MRLLVRIIAGLLGLAGVAFALFLYWVFFYSRDLPDFGTVAQFAPSATTRVLDPCFRTTVVVIPYSAIGPNLKAALNAGEGSENGPTAYKRELQAFSDVRQDGFALSTQIARTMFCSPSRMAMRRVQEIRTAMQLDRRFSRRDLFTIAANRYYFGEDLIGVQAASQYLFHSDPRDLSVPDAALLAGLVKAPSYYSPIRHPDRALKRRNEVLDAMNSQHAISSAEAEAAKTAPLRLAVTAE